MHLETMSVFGSHNTKRIMISIYLNNKTAFSKQKLQKRTKIYQMNLLLWVREIKFQIIWV